MVVRVSCKRYECSHCRLELLIVKFGLEADVQRCLSVLSQSTERLLAQQGKYSDNCWSGRSRHWRCNLRVLFAIYWAATHSGDSMHFWRMYDTVVGGTQRLVIHHSWHVLYTVGC